MPFLRIFLAIIAGLTTLVREIRELIGVTGPKSNNINKLPAYIIDIQPVKEPSIDMEQYQIDMEKLFNKNQLHPRIKAEFSATGLPFRDVMVKHGLDVMFGYDLLVQMVLHKRANLPTLVGILRKHFDGNCQQTADALLLACTIDLVDWNPSLKLFIIKYDISPDVQNDLDRYQYPLPMVVEPRELKKNEDTGYYTSRGSVILKDNHHNEDVCLDHLNRINHVKLTLNHEVATMIQNQWRNLDKPKPGEDRKEYMKRVKAFDKYDRTARDIMDHLEIAGGEFYLTHKYDKRGRVYCQGYHVNYQGNTWNKAVIEFAEQEVTDA